MDTLTKRMMFWLPPSACGRLEQPIRQTRLAAGLTLRSYVRSVKQLPCVYMTSSARVSSKVKTQTHRLCVTRRRILARKNQSDELKLFKRSPSPLYHLIMSSAASFIDTSVSSTMISSRRGDHNNNNHDNKENKQKEETNDKDEDKDLRAKEREAGMAELKRQFESSLDTIRTATKRLLVEIGTHVQETHKVIGEYEQILETQQQEATRLEEVNKSVLSATNPFLGSSNLAMSGEK